MRRRECAASCVKTSLPPSRSNSVPQSISCLTYLVPSVTRVSTAASSHRPAPATRVSPSWRSGLSSSDKTTATPPCAYSVLDSLALSLVRTVTSAPPDASSIAERRPATPLPMMMKSVLRGIQLKSNKKARPSVFGPARCLSGDGLSGRDLQLLPGVDQVRIRDDVLIC